MKNVEDIIGKTLISATFAIMLIGGISGAAQAEEDEKTPIWYHQTEAGMQNPNTQIHFYLYPEYHCELDMYENPSYEMAAATIVAVHQKKDKKREVVACWLEKDGVIMVFDEERRQFKHMGFQYEQIQ